MADGRKYSDEDVRAILDRALSRDASGTDGLSHADLLSVGEQVGVSADAMSKAADEVQAAKLERGASAAVLARRRRWLTAHAGVFAIVNGLLYAVNAATTPGQWWVLFPVFFWGLALLLHTGLTFGVAPSPRALERERRRLPPARGASAPKLRVEHEPETPADEESGAALGEKTARR
jgi:hypothetical protein